STANAVAGAQAGKNSCEYNNLVVLGSYDQASAALGMSKADAGT
ncbi:hypothetical protein D3M71_00535, partial [Erwinia billingiae]|nr:hypothetical protein [Erwinia billingiae]